MKKTVLASFIVAAALVPFIATAATAEELQAQIADLLTRINTLQQSLGASGGGAAATTGGVGAGGNAAVNPATVQCPHVSRVLKRGTTGQDVTRLQQFLALDPAVYPEKQITGYYGALTEAAVKRFQCKNKLVCDGTPESTGYGVTGPRTAALMALQCPSIVGGAGDVGGFIKVTPIQGVAPLPVTIDATVNTTKSCTGALYEVDYGDNSPKTAINVPANNCNELRQVLSHTYSSPGTYTIVLRSGTQQTYATVTVGGGVGGGVTGVVDALSASPLSGTVPFVVTFRGMINASSACTGNSYTLDFGNGQTGPLTPSGCTPSTFTVTHTYTTAGNFTARLTRDAGNVQMGSVAISAGGTSGGSGGSGGTQYGSYFSVTPGSGGDVFSVVADFEIPTPCTGFQLDWGDSSTQTVQSHSSCSEGSVRKQFQHTYASAGSYTVTLKRGANLSEVHSAGITISD